MIHHIHFAPMHRGMINLRRFSTHQPRAAVVCVWGNRGTLLGDSQIFPRGSFLTDIILEETQQFCVSNLKSSFFFAQISNHRHTLFRHLPPMPRIPWHWHGSRCLGGPFLSRPLWGESCVNLPFGHLSPTMTLKNLPGTATSIYYGRCRLQLLSIPNGKDSVAGKIRLLLHLQSSQWLLLPPNAQTTPHSPSLKGNRWRHSQK